LKKTGRESPGAFAVRLKFTSFFIFVACASQAFCQDISFSASADRTSVSLGEQIQVVAQLVSNKKLSGNLMPQVPKNDDFDVVSTNQNQNQSTSIQVVNGKMTQSVNITYLFYYTIAPKKQGSITFPALSCVIEGAPYTTNPFTIAVGKEQVQTPQATEVSASLILNKKNLYKGEQALLTVKVAQKANAQVQLNQQGLAGLYEKLEKALSKDFSVSRLFTQLPAKGSLEIVNGEKTFSVKVQYSLVPLSTGTLTIPALPFDYIGLKQVRSRRGDPFEDFFGGDPFFGGGVQQVQRSVMSNAFSVQVSSLPPSPAGFTGAVGNFTMNVTADPRSVPAGEAVTVSILFRGNARPNSMPDITMPQLADCEVFPPEKHVSVDTTPNGIMCQKGYKYLVVPKQEGTTVIPSLTWSYFDPIARSYKTLSSEPVTVTVTKGKTGQAAQTRYLTQEEIRQVGQDIRYIKTGVSLKRQTDQPYKNPVFFILFPLPFLIVLFSFMYKVQSERNEKDSSLILRRQALRKAKKTLSAIRGHAESMTAPEFCTKLAGGCEDFISEKFGFPATGRTLDELKQELARRGMQQTALDTCAAFFESLDAYRFGMTALDHAHRATLLEKAGQLIGELQKQKKGTSA
jgi:hypothetical protein